MPAPDITPDDQRIFALLEEFVAILHLGDERRCAAWKAAHPELIPMAECLGALESFVPPPSTSPAPADPDATVIRPHGLEGANGNLQDSFLGRDFGKYELQEEIGRGGMGVVYKAKQTDLNRTVALKMILSNHLAGGEDVKRFYREARAAGSLRHPHIVGIHEVGQLHGQHYFAMDYVAGKSLAAVLRAGPLDPERAVRLLQPVARAVQFLHDHAIIHRDLKPSNILIDPAGAPHVTDFGLAKVFDEGDDRTQTGVILGTPGYMPPEQAAGRVADISPRSDVYSLGAILYEMLTGRPPFREENQLNTILQVLESEPTLPNRLNPAVPPELERICLRCLEKAPEKRYATAAALADDLDRYLRDEPLEAQPANFAQRFKRWARREPGLASRLGGLLTAAVIVQTNHWLSHRPPLYHIDVKFTFLVWTILAFVFQWFQRREKTADLARLAWAFTDPILMTIVLYLAEADFLPLLIGYPLLVTASGLWFSVRLVAISTVMCLLSFVFLMVARHEHTDQPHYPVIYFAILGVIGFIVAFQVHRVRTLSRYFEQTRGP